MALLNRTEIGLKPTGKTAQIPNNPTARLMYYLDCMCVVLKMDDDADMNRLRRFRQHYLLTRSDRDVLIHLCILLKPDVLLNKCIFQEDALCGDSSNEFYDLERVRNNFLIAGNVLIGGRNRQVTKIMTFKMIWLKTNWTDPLQALLIQQRQERMEAMRQQQTSAGCNIL